MKNRIEFYQTLHHRIQMIDTLAQDFNKHAYLLPDLIIKTIKDTHRIQNQLTSHLNCIDIFTDFKIELSKEEVLFLQKTEHSLRKSKDYLQLTQNYHKNTLLSITNKLSQYLTTI